MSNSNCSMVMTALLCCCLLSATVRGQSPAAFRFDFGAGKAANGFVAVTPSMAYNAQRGFGFERTTALTAGGKSRKKSFKDDFITSDRPFYFSVKVPEGNYNVQVTLGDPGGTSENMIRVECRRMMTGRIRTGKGKIQSVSFTANVRDSLIAGTEKTVRLKPRERNYFHWDDRLTIEFNDARPKVCAVEITAAPAVPTLFLAGNSTVVDQAEEPYAAWGQMIPVFFQPGQLAVCNLAESGESLSSFIAARRLDKMISMMKPGDYAFVEFAHNDQKQQGPGIGPYTSYKRDLKRFITEIRKKGGFPVLVTSMHRRNFDSAGHIINTLGDYPAAMRQAAREENVPLIDLNNMSKVLYESWGEAASLAAFVHYPANTFPGQDKELRDNTHFNPYGAYQIAQCIARGIRENVPALAKWLKKDLPAFSPAKPDPVALWAWPLSPSTAAVKPDGN